MKKAFLALLGGVLFTFSAQAQDTTTESRKASAGNIALEANLNLFDFRNISLSNNLGQIKGRYYLSDDMALRLGADINYYNYSYDNNNLVMPTIVETKAFEISVNPGIEKHFSGTERLSPYIGAELTLQYRGTSATVDEGGSITEYKGSEINGGNRGYMGAGLNGLAGFDYYLAKHFFVGYELGLGLVFRDQKDLEITSGSGSTTKTIEGGSSTFFGPTVLNGVRVGFVLK
jgi:hypothetical protein